MIVLLIVKFFSFNIIGQIKLFWIISSFSIYFWGSIIQKCFINRVLQITLRLLENANQFDGLAAIKFNNKSKIRVVQNIKKKK